MRLIYGQDQIVVPWLCALLDMDIPHPCTSIGIAKDDRIIGGAIYSNQYKNREGKPYSIEISFGTIDKRWASRAIIGALLAYPFCQLRVKRAQSTVSKRNKHVRQFLERLGFTLEGVGRQAWPHGGDACVYSMLSGEFFSSKWNLNGQVHTFRSSRARPDNYIGSTNQV